MTKPRDVLVELASSVAVFVGAAALCCLLLAALLQLGFGGWQSVYFYRGLICLGAATAATALALALLARAGWGRGRDVVPASLFGAGLTLAFFVLVPVTIDRSVSVFLLGAMAAERDRVWTTEGLSEVLMDRYVRDFAQVERRIAEQRASGNVTAAGDGYRLTAQGERFIAASRWLGAAFAADGKFVDQRPAPAGRAGERRDRTPAAPQPLQAAPERRPR